MTKINFNQTPLVKFFSSIRLTVGCLLLLFVLVFWGTVAQVDQGLYYAQKKYFHSFFFLAAGFFPFPGGQLVLWVLFLNLLCVTFRRFIHQLKSVGIIIIHLGLLTYFVAAFMTFVLTKESQVSLYEDESSNVSADYFHWEISAWKDAGEKDTKTVLAYDVDLSGNKTYVFEPLGMTIETKDYYENARLEIDRSGQGLQEQTVSLTRLKSEKEPEKNLPAGQFTVKFSDGSEKDILLSGQMALPIRLDEKGINVQLRRKRHVLPFTLTLKRFNKEVHPNTEIASKYESYVEIEHDGLKRSKKIFMNNPLRFKDYTVYQAAFAIDQAGRHKSTLAVVKNSAQIMPYISSFLVFAGLLVHFLSQMIKSMRKNRA